ncbi:unnamed protein product, partial [Polarella glacialis]
ATSSPMMTRAARRRRPGFGATLLAPRGYRGSVSPVRRAAGPEVSEAFVGIEESAWAVALTAAALWATCRTGELSEDFVLRGGAFKASCHQLLRNQVQIAAGMVPNLAFRIFLSRLASVPDPCKFLAGQTAAGLNLAGSLVVRPFVARVILPHSPAILPHLPAIYTRLSILEPHVPGIVRILDPYLGMVEPHLDRIMERMDQIEPHLPYILLHLDVLAKHC